MNFNQKTAVVTGAGQGIGFEICRQLAEEGAIVILNDQDENLALKAAESLTSRNLSCYAYPGDASQQSCINGMIQLAVEKGASLDIVIANAGITLFGDFLEYNRDDFSSVIKVNLEGGFFLSQAAAKQMIRQQSGGSILFTSSVTGHQAHKNLAAYAITKAGLEMLAKNLVIELSGYGISVNCIAPGATMTERTRSEKGYLETWSRLTPMGRPAEVTEIAQAALFLVSEPARHITGQSLIIDGGWTSISPSPI
jgi:glucose 1-dehydrogenase